MVLPKISQTIQSAWRLKWTIVPFFLANITLIGLISYRLINSKQLSDSDKKNFSYAELVSSFIGSFAVLVLFGILSVATLYVSITRFEPKPFYGFLFLGSIFILLNPFSLTGIRIFLSNKLSEQQEDIISGLIIPVALFISYLTVHVFDGFFMG